MDTINKTFKKIKRQLAIFNFILLEKIGKLLCSEYRFKSPQIDWWYNQSFDNYLRLFGALKGLNADRRWMLYQLLRLIEDIPGDTAECGVYQGETSYLICKANWYNKKYRRWHYMFDSFEGISEPHTFDGAYWIKGDLSAEGDSVAKRKLSEFNNIKFFKGWIPDRFHEIENKRFAFAHIDVDLYEPTRDSIAFFYPRVEKGGIIICDDYGFKTCPGATKAINDFLVDKPEKMISLSCGGGFLIKNSKISDEFI
jgi:hypothetical protein